jgi:hypothetical protein
MPGIKIVTGAVAACAFAAIMTMVPAPAAVSAPAQAEPRPAKARVVPPARADWSSDKTVTATSDAACPRTRRKLWVESEGWVVRRVAVCR